MDKSGERTKENIGRKGENRERGEERGERREERGEQREGRGERRKEREEKEERDLGPALTHLKIQIGLLHLLDKVSHLCVCMCRFICI